MAQDCALDATVSVFKLVDIHVVNTLGYGILHFTLSLIYGAGMYYIKGIYNNCTLIYQPPYRTQ